MTVRRRVAAATAPAVLVLLGLAVGWVVAQPAPDASRPAATVVLPDHGPYFGTLLDPPVGRPALRLPDTAGRLFDLPTRPAGEVTVLFFGYTHCDDVCPTTMADLAAARRTLPPSAQAHVNVVFVTEDPARDTPSVLRRWLDSFDPAIVGLIGGNSTTKQVLTQLHLPPSLRYRVAEPARHAPGLASHTGYRVEHSGVVYAFGPRRRTVIYTGGTTPRQYAADFTRLVRD